MKYEAGLRDLVRVITRADQPTQGEENEVLDDDEDEEEEEIAEEDADGDEDDGESESDDPDTKMAQEIGPEAGPEDLTERPAGMEIDNGVTSTSGHVRLLQGFCLLLLLNLGVGCQFLPTVTMHWT